MYHAIDHIVELKCWCDVKPPTNNTKHAKGIHLKFAVVELLFFYFFIYFS